MSLRERPRERLERLGECSLSDAELLAVILRSGGPDMDILELSQKLMHDFGGMRGLLFADYNQLQSIRYLGRAKVSCIKAVGEIAKRCVSPESQDRLKVINPATVYKLIRPRILGKSKEVLYLLSLDLAQRLIKINTISVGTLSQTLSDVREVLRAGLLNNAVSIIIVHNHPSGNTTPSKEDQTFTRRLALAAPKVGLNLLDHLVVTSDEYLSFKSEGLLSFNTEGGERK